MNNNTHFFNKKLYEDLKNGKHSNISRKIRDLTVISIENDFYLVIAVDSDGGIGSLPDDVIQCTAHALGRFAMRVPLMEVLASGAAPVAAFDMLTVPMDKYGQEIIAGVKTELEHAGLSGDFPLSGSTEDNIPMPVTGIATVVIGMVHKNDFKPGCSRKEDIILCIGKPKSAPADEVKLEDNEIIQQHQVRKILKIKNVHDILPVGSKGIEYEAWQIAKSAGLKFIPGKYNRIDMKKSAGPSTCILVSGETNIEKEISGRINAPVAKIGILSDD